MKHKTILGMFANTLEKYPSNPFVYYKKTLPILNLKTTQDLFTPYTYNDINTLKYKYNDIFREYNVKKSDNIVFVGANSPDWISSNFSSWNYGCNFVPIYNEQHIDVIEHIIWETEPKLVLYSKQSEEKIKKIKQMYNEKNNKSSIRLTHTNFLNYSEINFDKISELKSTNLTNLTNAENCGLILYTSGTTGLAKGVCLSIENLSSNINSIDKLIGNKFITESDKYFSFLPWSHIYGLNCELYYGMSKGASFYLNDDIKNISSNIIKSNPTIICSVPKLLYSIYDKLESNIFIKSLLATGTIEIFAPLIKKKIFGTNLRFINTGGSFISLHVLNFYKKLGIDIYQGYGLSETSPIISLNSHDANKLGSVGKILDCNQVKIVDGEIYVKGSNVFVGYYKNPDETTKSFDSKGYYKTGDNGSIDSDGYLHIDGRVKDLYKLTNGKYINPIFIENILMESEYISQVFVYGDSKPYNIVLVVFAQNSNTQNIPLDTQNKIIQEQITKLSGRMPKYSVPQKFLIVNPFTFEDKLLTAKMSLIRKNILSKYSDQIAKLY